MRRIIAAINMTIDGVFDHTEGLPDEEIHQHYTDLLNSADLILYGSTTYQLMRYWQGLITTPSGEKTADDFAIAIDKIQKVVFSHNLQDTGWDTAKIVTKPLKEFVEELKQQTGKYILVGSRSLIIQLMNLDLLDEFQLCVYPVIAAKGSQLFEHVNNRAVFKLANTKHFTSGAVILHYQPAKR